MRVLLSKPSISNDGDSIKNIFKCIPKLLKIDSSVDWAYYKKSFRKSPSYSIDWDLEPIICIYGTKTWYFVMIFERIILSFVLFFLTDKFCLWAS